MSLSARIENRLQLVIAAFARYGFAGAIWLFVVMARARMLRRRFVDLPLPHSRRTLRARATASDSDVATFRQVFLRLDYELAYMPHARRLAERAGLGVSILDCGANIGCSTLYFEHVFPEAHILAIEPESSNVALLRHNLRDSPNSTCVQAGVARDDGTLRVGNPGVHSWAYRTELAAAGDDGALPGFSVETLLKRLPQAGVVIVKMDVEGAEREIFSGASDWLGNVDLLVVEIHDWMLPWEGSSRPLFRALARYPVEINTRGENVFCFFDRESPARAA